MHLYKGRLISGAIACAFSLQLVACGGDDDDSGTGPDNSTLTQAEFESMFEAYGELASVAFDFSGAFAANGGASALLAAQSSQTYTFDENEPCPAGGTMRLQGSIMVAGGSEGTTLDATVTQTHANCRSESEGGGTWTFNGNPNISTTYDATFAGSGESFSITGSQTGGFRWTSPGGKGGTCSININVTLTGSSQGIVGGRVTGTVCGRAVDENVEG